MSEADIIDVVQQALMLIIKISTPVMLVGLVVGVVIALVQALTQIQEMTLAFVPKMIAIFVSIFVLFPTFAAMLIKFTEELADKIISLG